MEMTGLMDGLRALVEMAVRHFAARCTLGGTISLDRIDEHQALLFDLALLASQLVAAEQLLHHADKLDASGARDAQLMRELAQLNAADVIAGGLRCFAYREESFGLTPDAVMALQRNSAAFVRVQHQPARQAAVAELLLADGLMSAGDLTGEQRAIQSTFRRYAETQVAPIAQQIHVADSLLPDAIIQDLAEIGCFGLSIPQQYGGGCEDRRCDRMAMVLATQELSRVSFGTVGSLLIRPELVSGVLLKGGSEAQKERWLPLIARGEVQVAVAVTEPDRGSDIADLRLAARRAPGGWLLNGRKMWCTMAGRADLIMVLARTGPGMGDARNGLSLFLVEKPPSHGRVFAYEQAHGRLSGRAIPTLGYRGLHTFELAFENFFVPDDNLIGGAAGQGQGYHLQIHSFAGGRLQTAARALGVMDAAYEAAFTYAQQRWAFGRPLHAFALTQRKLVRMAMLLEAGRRLTYHAAQETAWLPALIAGAMAKLLTARSAEWVTREAQQIHGGLGYAEETPVARHFVDARLLSIFEGSDEIVAVYIVAWLLLSQAAGYFEQGRET